MGPAILLFWLGVTCYNLCMANSTHTQVAFSQDEIRRFRIIQSLLNRLDPDVQPQALILPGSPAPTGSIVVFPGSFNPPTNAHLAMLRQAQRFEQLRGTGPVSAGSVVYAAISKRTTDKERVERPLLVDRIALQETVLQHHTPGVGIMLFNLGLYVEQAEGIRSAFPGVMTLYFLVGFDKIAQIFDARYYTDRDAALRELFALAELLVAPRAGSGEEELRKLLDAPQNRQFARHVHLLPLDAQYRDISSTDIRQDFAAHRQDVPPEVQRFIRETHAYEQAQKLPDGSIRDIYGERIKAIEAVLRDENR